MYRVLLTRRAIKGLDKAPPHIKEKAKEAIEALEQSLAPARAFDIRKLKGIGDTFRN